MIDSFLFLLFFLLAFASQRELRTAVNGDYTEHCGTTRQT